MKVNPNIFKAYDIRGIYPDEMNKEMIPSIARAIYTFLSRELGKEKLTLVVGRDMRQSSPDIHDALISTLEKYDVQITDLELASTPTVYFAVHNKHFDAGIQITASHNPAKYNGIKLLMRKQGKIAKIGQNTGLPDIKDIALNENFAEFNGPGYTVIDRDMLKEEVDEALLSVHPGDVSHLKVVIDPANAMGILPMKELFERLDATSIMINNKLDGTFPAHEADPLQKKNLAQLQKQVLVESADIGLAPDGDADRVLLVDEKGQIVSGTLVTALVAKSILNEKSGQGVVADIRYTRNVENAVSKYKGKVYFSPVGHVFFTDLINRKGAVFGGETSGHYYFGELDGAESSVRLILRVLKIVAEEKRPLSEIIKDVQTSYEYGEVNFELPEALKTGEMLDELKKEYSDGELSTMDGVAISYPDWRFSVRSSNTEPLLRLNVEGQTEDTVNLQYEKLSSFLKGKGAKIKA